MYEIYEGLSVELNRVTPFTVKKYQEMLKRESTETEKNIGAIVESELPKHLENDENGIPSIKANAVKSILATAIQENVVASLDIYANREFVDEWIELIFKITPEQVEKTKDGFDQKFYMDEFMRGFTDFFVRLRGRSV